MRVCKYCGLNEKQVYMDMHEVGGIGCAHAMAEEVREETKISPQSIVTPPLDGDR